MRHLNIFDDNKWVATVSVADGKFFIFAASSREYSDIKRWIDSGFYRVNKKHKQIKVNPEDKDFLEKIAERAHGYNFNTELINESKIKK